MDNPVEFKDVQNCNGARIRKRAQRRSPDIAKNGRQEDIGSSTCDRSQCQWEFADWYWPIMPYECSARAMECFVTMLRERGWVPTWHVLGHVELKAREEAASITVVFLT